MKIRDKILNGDIRLDSHQLIDAFVYSEISDDRSTALALSFFVLSEDLRLSLLKG